MVLEPIKRILVLYTSDVSGLTAKHTPPSIIKSSNPTIKMLIRRSRVRSLIQDHIVLFRRHIHAITVTTDGRLFSSRENFLISINYSRCIFLEFFGSRGGNGRWWGCMRRVWEFYVLELQLTGQSCEINFKQV